MRSILFQPYFFFQVTASYLFKYISWYANHSLYLDRSLTHVITSIEELQEFFKGTFIQKQVGYVPDETEAFYKGEDLSYAKGFNPSWSLYRFHHVCVRGGSDGLYAGMEGVQLQSMTTTGIVVV